MSELKDLVPDLELCRMIPAGKFEHTALVWANSLREGVKICPRIFIDGDGCEHHYEGIPAPTFTEIILAISTLEILNEKAIGIIYGLYFDLIYHKWVFEMAGYSAAADDPTTAALIYWLKMETKARRGER